MEAIDDFGQEPFHWRDRSGIPKGERDEKSRRQEGGWRADTGCEGGERGGGQRDSGKLLNMTTFSNFPHVLTALLRYN